MKDKQGSKLTMNDVINKYKVKDDELSPVEQQTNRELETLKEEINSDEYFQKLKDYNESFPNIDPLYSNIKPLHNVIVRVKVKEPQLSKSGLLKPYKQIVPIPTQNGMGEWAEIESPYPYDTQAVVVAKPDSTTTVNVGDNVILSKNPVEAKVVGRSNEAYINIPNVFTHPEWKEDTPPKDPTNKHYGYLLIPVYEIKCIL